MTDYFIEHGQHLPSADPIRARLALFDRFREMEQSAQRLPAPLMPDHIDDNVLNRFRKWGIEDPIIARRKDVQGNWVDGQKRKRAASTVEESVIQLKAALNYAFRNRRVRYVPPLTHKTRDQVTPQRTYRLSVETLGEMLDYTFRGAGNYKGHAERLMPMRRYLIAAICTLARPDAIFDMSVLAERGQWMVNEKRFDLNPAGRIQTKKVRPVVPVVDVLHSWLSVTDDRMVCGVRSHFDDRQHVEVLAQYRVASVRKAWSGICDEFRIPTGWGPKLIRHSMATILANRRVDLIELEMALGHRVLGKTSSRYAIFDPDYLGTVKGGLADVVADLTKMAGPALHAKLTQKDDAIAILRA